MRFSSLISTDSWGRVHPGKYCSQIYLCVSIIFCFEEKGRWCTTAIWVLSTLYVSTTGAVALFGTLRFLKL